MARNINFIWNPQVSVYVIKFDYDKQFVDVIKSAVPGNCRTYDTQTREWYVTENYFDGLKMVADAILKPRGYKIYTFTRAQAEEFNQPAPQSELTFNVPVALAGIISQYMYMYLV